MKNFNQNDSVEVILDKMTNQLFERIVSIDSNTKEVDDLVKLITTLVKKILILF